MSRTARAARQEPRSSSVALVQYRALGGARARGLLDGRRLLDALALELLATLSTAIIAVEIGFRLLYNRMEFQPALFLLVLAPEFYMPLRALGARFHAGMNGTTAAKRCGLVSSVPSKRTNDNCASVLPGRACDRRHCA